MNGATAELETARQTLPNDARLFELKGYIERRRPVGTRKRRYAISSAQSILTRETFSCCSRSCSVTLSLRYRRRSSYLGSCAVDRAEQPEMKATRAELEFDWKANTRPLHQLMDELRTKDPSAIQSVADSWLICALAERDAAAATKAVGGAGRRRCLATKRYRFRPPFLKAYRSDDKG